MYLLICLTRRDWFDDRVLYALLLLLSAPGSGRVSQLVLLELGPRVTTSLRGLKLTKTGSRPDVQTALHRQQIDCYQGSPYL